MTSPESINRKQRDRKKRKRLEEVMKQRGYPTWEIERVLTRWASIQRVNRMKENKT